MSTTSTSPKTTSNTSITFAHGTQKRHNFGALESPGKRAQESFRIFFAATIIVFCEKRQFEAPYIHLRNGSRRECAQLTQCAV